MYIYVKYSICAADVNVDIIMQMYIEDGPPLSVVSMSVTVIEHCNVGCSVNYCYLYVLWFQTFSTENVTECCMLCQG